MEALQYLGIIQVFSFFPSSSNLAIVAQVMMGAMDQERFFRNTNSIIRNNYQQFLQLWASLDFIIENF